MAKQIQPSAWADMDLAYTYIQWAAGVRRREVETHCAYTRTVSFILHPLLERDDLYKIDTQAMIDRITHNVHVTPVKTARKVFYIGVGKWIERFEWNLGQGRQIIMMCKPKLELTLIQRHIILK